MKTSQKVHEDAKSLLEDTHMVEILSAFGKVHIVGSYAANLMRNPDIDIVVITGTPQESAIRAIGDLARKELFQKLEFGDFKNYPMKNRPESFIVNVRKEWKGEEWEIETWFVTDIGDRLEVLEKLKNLSEADRKKIIDRKMQRSLSGNTKHDLSSWEIYRDFI